MDKKTLLAVVASVVVISLGFILQAFVFSPKETAVNERTRETVQEAQPVETAEEQRKSLAPSSGKRIFAVPEEGLTEKLIRTEDFMEKLQMFDVTFSTRGGIMTSLKLKKHKDGNSFVEMINTRGAASEAFDIYLGGVDADPIHELFNFRRIDAYTYEFYRTFAIVPETGGEGVPFTLKKTYVFKPNEYLFELRIGIENSVNEYPALNFNGVAYTLGFGPQIGPHFAKLDGRQEYRKYFSYADGKRKEQKLNKQGLAVIDNRVSWVSITGKYFTLIGIPDATQYSITFSNQPGNGMPDASKLYFSRPPIKSSKNTDVYRFYIGPKLSRELSIYNDSAKNDFGIKGLKINEVIDANVLLGWLEYILKVILELFYKLIPNYGVAIIFLTILVKAATFPLTYKSYESTARMQSLNPKMEEIRAKYKNNPQKMNQEIGALYKKEKVSPLGGCLPMLLQIPFFFALYGLLNTHFELRGAIFLPPWISDLSAPESVWNFAPFRIPLLGWTDLRILPFIFVGTQVLMTKFTQAPSTSANKQMAIMNYAIPIIFFFILYDMPSGLLVYWIVTNILSAAQQMYSNYRRAKKAKSKSK